MGHCCKLELSYLELQINYKPSDWLKNENQRWLFAILAEFKIAWILCHPACKLTYYAHIVADHLFSIVISLAYIGLTIIDVTSQGLENAHCTAARLCKWGGSGTYILHKGVPSLLPFSSNFQEMIRVWTPLIFIMFPNEISKSALQPNNSLQEFIEKSRDSKVVKLAPKFRGTSSRPDFNDWEEIDDVPVEAPFIAKVQTLSDRTLQKHRSQQFKVHQDDIAQKVKNQKKKDPQQLNTVNQTPLSQ